MVFENRATAGRQLAQALLSYKDQDPIVFALPRGGVPIGYEVAKALHAPLDVVVTRKIGAPENAELGIGAISIGDVYVLNDWLIQQLRISKAYLQTTLLKERAELERRLARYRGNQPLPNVAGKTAILVDDGLATGITAKAGLLALRKLGPRQLIFAAPVCATDSVRKLEGDAEAILCLESREDLIAVGLWYQDFRQTTDEEVLALLARNQQERTHGQVAP